MAEILHQLRLVVYPIIYRVSYIPGGARFQPSTVSPQQPSTCWAPICFRYEPNRLQDENWFAIVVVPSSKTSLKWGWNKKNVEPFGFITDRFWAHRMSIFFQSPATPHTETKCQTWKGPGWMSSPTGSYGTGRFTPKNPNPFQSNRIEGSNPIPRVGF